MVTQKGFIKSGKNIHMHYFHNKTKLIIAFSSFNVQEFNVLVPKLFI